MPLHLEPIIVTLGRVLFIAFRTYFELLETLIRFLVPGYRRPPFLAKIVSGENNISIDERILKIDAARENLSEAITAIDDLRSQADANKRDLQDALDRINEAEAQKQSLAEELATIRKLAEADTQSFRRVIGLPTRADVWRERLLGFGSGILASVIASIIYAVATSFIFAQK